MRLFVVALMMEQKECGLYSRTIHESLVVRPLLAADRQAAWSQAKDDVVKSFAPERGWIIGRSEVVTVDDRLVIDAAMIAERMDA